MSFIIFDLEFNQDASSLQNYNKERSTYPFEILQIGAIKLDANLDTIDTFNRYVRPTFYAQINPFVEELTGITTDQLQSEESFPEVYNAFTAFIYDSQEIQVQQEIQLIQASQEKDTIFCTWGMSDMAILFRNVEDHRVDLKLLPRLVIDLQFYVTKHFDLPQKNRMRLQHAVEHFHIPITHPFHSASHDAYYTTEIFKKIYHVDLKPKSYDPTHRPVRPKKLKSVIDTDKLLQQFEKMYAREITEEEQKMILLAYKMGRTNQFVNYLEP